MQDDIQDLPATRARGDSQFYCFCLSFYATTGCIDHYIKFIRCFNGFKRRFNLVLQINQRKISFIIFTVNGDLTISFEEKPLLQLLFYGQLHFFVFPLLLFLFFPYREVKVFRKLRFVVFVQYADVLNRHTQIIFYTFYGQGDF